jgi:hypothetical protein
MSVEAFRDALQIVRLAMFAALLILGFRVMRATGPRRRRAINQFIVYVLFAHVVILIPQTEAWPFAMYPMMATNATARDVLHRGVFFRVVDENGREWRVDEQAWSPLYPQSVAGWFAVGWPLATPDERRVAMRFLLRRAEEARQHRRNGDRFFGNALILGPLAAPDTNLWGDAPQSPARLRALRVYRIEWIPTELYGGQKVVSRTLAGEYGE